ncbi:MAG: formylglycine-generating enzyme family protein [Kiritimatiellae bacterium]|nr:formylglycine-generating enzyme family protein [Kiritimatiellia bacterium]
MTIADFRAGFARVAVAFSAVSGMALVGYAKDEPAIEATPSPVLTNVSATASVPWNGKVTLKFEIENNVGAVYPAWNQPRLSITATDNVTGSNYVAAASALMADAAALAGSNGTHEVVWDMSKQGIDLTSTGVAFTVTYLKMNDYCVFDLSGIPTAPIDLSNGVDVLTGQELRIANAQVLNDIMAEEGVVSNLTTQITGFDAQLTAVQETYDEAGYNKTDLAQLEQDVKDLMAQEAAARQAVVDNHGQTLDNNNYYKDFARPLAKAMIKYYLVYAGEVPAAELDSVDIGEWFSVDYMDKHFCVRYIKSPGGLTEKYFDYVTCDSDGNPLIKKDGTDKFDDAVTNVAGIVVLEKVPTYAYYKGDDNTKLVAVKSDQANRNVYQAELNAKTMKGVNVCGERYLVAQRSGWTTAAAGDSKKGAVRIGLNAGKEAVSLATTIEDITAAKTDLGSQKSAAETKLSGLNALLSAVANRLEESEGTSAVPDVVCPVSYLDAPPEDGWTDLHKTSNLVMRLIGPEKSGARPFYCAVFETTQRQWELVTGRRPSYFTNETFYAMRPAERISYDTLRGTTAGAQWPETNSVDDASFLGVLRTLTGFAFDLPTEAQWEFACRAGTTTDYNNGENLPKEMGGRSQNSTMEKLGRYHFNGGKEGEDNPSCTTNAGTATVGSYPSNDWGLYDMHGNVGEWCLDWCVDDPSDARYPGGRVIRGGSWFDYASYCISSGRIGESPANAESGFGLRLVLTVDGDAPAFGRAVCAGASESIRVGVTASVSNVVARQRWPWNGLVDIDYDVSGHTDGLKAEIVFEEQDGEGCSWPTTKFLAGFEPSAERGHHRATWNAMAEGAANIVARVKAVVRLVEGLKK